MTPLLAMILPTVVVSAYHVIAQPTAMTTYESVEYLEGVSDYPAAASETKDGSGGNYTIDTRAFWLDKPDLIISVSSENASAAAVQSVKGMISGNTTMSGQYSQWNDLLSAFQQAAVPRLSLADGNNAGANANVKVMLTDAAYEDNRPGKTRLLADKATGEIVQAKVYVYSADKLREQGMLEYVVAHELGHALGLSHSTDPKSIMYPLIELEDGHVVNRLGSCETEGISALYLESRIGSEYCR